jgi:hypothetical protein
MANGDLEATFGRFTNSSGVAEDEGLGLARFVHGITEHLVQHGSGFCTMEYLIGHVQAVSFLSAHNIVVDTKF